MADYGYLQKNRKNIYLDDKYILHNDKTVNNLIDEQEKVLTNNTEIKTEDLTFINPEKFNECSATSVKIGRLVFIVGNFVPNTQVGGDIINLKYKPIHPDRFWGVLHNGNSDTTSPCYVNGYKNTPYLSAYTMIKANAKYWIDIKYITNE